MRRSGSAGTPAWWRRWATCCGRGSHPDFHGGGRLAAVVGEPGCAGDDSEGSEGSDGPAFNAGAARPKHGQESKEEKRARKAEAKEAKNARRAEKKQTKREFSQAKSSQIAVSMATKQQPSTSFSRWE